MSSTPQVVKVGIFMTVCLVLLGWLILREPLSSAVLLGGAIIVSGVVLVVSGERLGRGPQVSHEPVEPPSVV